MKEEIALRVMTYNIGGGRKDSDFGSGLKKEIVETIRKCSPDLLGLQECTEWTDSEHARHGSSVEIAEALGARQDRNYYFGKTLSLQENLQVKKAVMLFGLYQDWIDWAQGNALYARHGFTRFGRPEEPGWPRNVPIYRPPAYEGTRDTDPRFAIIARARFPGLDPYVVCTHLTTLYGERGGELREIPGKSNEAQMLRFQQAKILLELLRPKMEERKVILLMGDFNAGNQEACLASVLEREGEFIRLVPREDIPTHMPDHPKVPNAVDHILVYPRERVKAYSCWIDNSDEARAASDHLPVVADITFD